MKECRSCGISVTNSAVRCPACNCDVRNFFLRHKIITTILCILGLALFGAILSMLGLNN